MNAETMMTTLKSLKLFGMADTIGTMATQASPVYQQAVPILETLLKAEVAEREVRSINYQMKVARFPAYRDLAGFDFTQSAVDEALVKSLHRCEFLEDAQNIVFVGGPGTGKTHPGYCHCRAGHPAPPIPGTLFTHHRTGQPVGTGKARGQTGPSGQPPDAHRPGDPG